VRRGCIYATALATSQMPPIESSRTGGRLVFVDVLWVALILLVSPTTPDRHMAQLVASGRSPNSGASTGWGPSSPLMPRPLWVCCFDSRVVSFPDRMTGRALA
jgi:hypothetical protein